MRNEFGFQSAIESVERRLRHSIAGLRKAYRPFVGRKKATGIAQVAGEQAGKGLPAAFSIRRIGMLGIEQCADSAAFTTHDEESGSKSVCADKCQAHSILEDILSDLMHIDSRTRPFEFNGAVPDDCIKRTSQKGQIYPFFCVSPVGW
ncbi:hypothetical protein A9978_04340 [Pseudomonas sp. UMC65]|nr:hypothetical protein [Pseudomonas sp. UMC65]MBB1621797.1 hypothetical protein [Pseudomonas sp. UME65]